MRLERIEGLTLHILDADMLDGTPVLDLKPYIAYTDSHPDAGNGWLDDADPVQAYDVQFDPLAMEQVQWIEARTGLALGERIRATLALGPEPHPYRRIRRVGEAMQLAVKEWRVRFSVDDHTVRVSDIASGFRVAQLAGDAKDDVLRTHREFREQWP